MGVGTPSNTCNIDSAAVGKWVAVMAWETSG